MSSLRVTAGSLRGRRVPLPPGDVRPTSERARQAYFNIVGDRVSGAHFLDLFAGSGIFSFEALSRGAASATAVDQSRKNVEQMQRLAASFGVSLQALAADVLSTGRWPLATSPDLVYADPPYDFGRYDDLLGKIDTLPLSEDAVVTVEHRRNTSPFASPPAGLRMLRRAEYGEVWMTFFERVRPLQ